MTMASLITNNSMSPFVEKLSDSNYSMWKFVIQMLLEDKDLWEIMEGTPTTPSDIEEAKEAYDKLQWKAVLLIVTNVNDQQVAHLKRCKTSKRTWDKLQEVHESKTIANDRWQGHYKRLIPSWQPQHCPPYAFVTHRRLDVQLLQLEVVDRTHGQQHAQRRHLCNRSKHLTVVHSVHL